MRVNITVLKWRNLISLFLLLLWFQLFMCHYIFLQSLYAYGGVNKQFSLYNKHTHNIAENILARISAKTQ